LAVYRDGTIEAYDEQDRRIELSAIEKAIGVDFLADIAKPLSRRELYTKRWGYEEEEGGGWRYKIRGREYTFGGEDKSTYPILSHRYSSDVHRAEKLEQIPSRAPSFTRIVEELQEDGVKWKEFWQLKVPPNVPERWSLAASGLQAVGELGDLVVIVESKVGVGRASAGYLYQVQYFLVRFGRNFQR